MNNILILEDHPLVQTWIVQLIGEIFPSAKKEVAATIEACEQYIGEQLDLILVDLNLPDGKGQDVIARVKQQFPNIRCVVMTSFDDDEHLFTSLKAGADGYLLKDQPIDELTTLLKGILQDKPPLSPTVAQRMMLHFRKEKNTDKGNDSDNDKPTTAELTPRENETLKLISRGFSAKEVAREMDISPNTVSGYIKEIYRKLNIHSRAEAATLSLKLGL